MKEIGFKMVLILIDIWYIVLISVRWFVFRLIDMFVLFYSKVNWDL